MTFLSRSCSLIVIALTVLICLVSAAQDFRGQIQPNAELAHLINLGPNTKVVLQAVPAPPSSSAVDAHQNLAQLGQTRDRVTWVGGDGSFIFKDVAEGVYTLEILSRTHTFNTYRVDIGSSSDKASAPQIRLFVPGTSLISIQSSNLVMHPLILRAVARKDFYTEAAPLTLSSLIGMGGPMMILGVLAMGLVFALPKITAALDPDAQRELAESRAKMQKRMAAFHSGDMASLLQKDEPSGKTQAVTAK